MATASVTLTATSAAMINQQEWDYNENGAKIYQLQVVNDVYGTRYLLFNFPDFPMSLQFNRLLGVRYAFRFADIKENALLSIRTRPRVDAATITWRTFKDDSSGYWVGTYSAEESNAWQTASLSLTDEYGAQQILRNFGTLVINANMTLYSDDVFQIYGGAGGNWPTLTVEYDDSYLVPLDVKYDAGPRDGRYVDRRKFCTFGWTAKIKEGEYCTGDLEQVSAIFRWRVGDAGAWNDVLPENPTDTSVTIPANTFPVSDDLQWKVDVTATNGQTYDFGEVYSFATTDRETVATPQSPISAYRNPRGTIAFTWSTYNSTGSTPTGADLQTYNGTEWIDLGHVDGAATTFTVPANTFTVGSVQWRVRAYNADGVAGPWSSGVTFSTTDSNTSAAPESPSGTVEDGSAPIIFRWIASNPSGSTPTGADLQRWVTNAWVDLAHVDGPAKTYTAPANTFTAGANYWRVRAYNADGVAGPWSAFVTFTVVAAPLAPTVSVDAVPFAVIRWQVEGQQAWRATVDGKAYGPYFGTDKSFTLPDYLADGEHTVTVEVQGQYGLWSEPGSYTFTVTNQPGDQISLQGDFGIDAALRWDPPAPTNDYLIYRDGVQIGHTTSRTFTDRVVQGVHEWTVINRLPGGYYSRSNTVQGELSTEQLALALLSGGEWLELEKTATPSRMEDYAATQTVEIFHITGQEYPEAETAPYKTMQASFTVAWNLSERAQAAAFEALIGKPIIYKAPSGETLVGVLQAFGKQVVHFYRAYSATVQRIHWRDYVEDD